MAELVVSGEDTVRLIRPQAAIVRAPTAVTAFVGRTLKGPVNQPVSLHSFDDYQRVFGGLWQPSTLSYAIEQFFESGGRSCIVVRVCNGGRAPTLRLPAGSAALQLTGLAPGTREFLRASVDYDGIATEDTDRFNLVVQRIRAPGSEFIEDQEIFRRVSIEPDADRTVATVLAESRLVRLTGPLPAQRPDRSGGAPPAATVGYVACNGDGDDGDALTHYDVIGDARAGSGLFALRGAASFNFLCVPPLSRDADVGLPALLVALRLCRERQAMLIVDPPSSWGDAGSALEQLRNWPFHNENALMFFPRVVGFDRLRGRYETFGSAAAAAGLLARGDESCPVWSAAEGDEVLLRPGLRAALTVSDVDRQRLAHFGVNTLPGTRATGRPRTSLRTLMAEGAGRGEWRYLAARRFALFVMSSIEHGTRWATFEQSGPALWARVSAHVTRFFEALEDEGAFVGRSAEENYFVICDERLNERASSGGGRLQVLFGFAHTRPSEFHTCLVTHEPAGSSVRNASLNRLALLHGS